MKIPTEGPFRYTGTHSRHTFAGHSVWFCLINLLNMDTRYATIMGRVDTDPFISFKFYLKRQILESYKNDCFIVNCNVCRQLKINDLLQ